MLQDNVFRQRGLGRGRSVTVTNRDSAKQLVGDLAVSRGAATPVRRANLNLALRVPWPSGSCVVSVQKHQRPRQFGQLPPLVVTETLDDPLSGADIAAWEANS